MSYINVEIICPFCGGDGHRGGSGGGTDCENCSGSGYLSSARVESSILTDIMDKCNDILDKCNDIKEKVDEL